MVEMRGKNTEQQRPTFLLAERWGGGGLVPLTGGQGTEGMAAKLEAAGWRGLVQKG